MSRMPSEKTQLATAKSEIKRLKAELQSAESALRAYRTRATQAEQACADWKQRFDKLLEFRNMLRVEQP